MTYTLADYVRDHGRPPRRYIARGTPAADSIYGTRALAPATDAVLAPACV